MYHMVQDTNFGKRSEKYTIADKDKEENYYIIYAKAAKYVCHRIYSNR